MADRVAARQDSRQPARRDPPTGGRALETYDSLIKAAGEILGDVGFERLTTNEICARAGVTPPTLYRYFNDKYDVLEVLAQRLLTRQNDAYAIWLYRRGNQSGISQVDLLQEWFEIAADIVASEPGALWTMRALRALPNLAHVRLQSQRMNTDRLFNFYRHLYPAMDPHLLWQKLRIRSEFGWVVDELAIEEDRLSHKVLFREAARLLGSIVDPDDTSPES